MAIEAVESDREISMEEAMERKMQILRDADRMAAVDGAGRFLYLLLKLHLVRIALQFAVGIVVTMGKNRIPVRQAILDNVSLVGIDGVAIIGPFLVLLVVVWQNQVDTIHRQDFAGPIVTFHLR